MTVQIADDQGASPTIPRRCWDQDQSDRSTDSDRTRKIAIGPRVSELRVPLRPDRDLAQDGTSLPFVMLCGNRLRPGRVIGPGALARRFFDTGVCPDDPQLVPTAAWVAGCGPEARIMEHSVANAEGQVVMTILWDPTDTGIPRPAMASLPFVTACRDYLLDELNDQAVVTRRNKA